MNEDAPSGDVAGTLGQLSPLEMRFERRRRTLGLFTGPLAFLALLLFPPPLLAEPAARLTPILALVLIWWITEAVPIPVTALLGPALVVLLGLAPAREVFAGFGDPVILLFLGSFVLAEAMALHRLDRRVAYALLSTRFFGRSALRILVGFTLLAAALSMWLSNTATTAMLYPIAMGVLGAVGEILARRGEGRDIGRTRFAAALLLVCAYGSSVGGIGTPVGTPPNLIALGQLATLAGVKIAFFEWMLIALPIALAMLAFILCYLRIAFAPEVREISGSAEFIAEERRRLGPWTAGQRNVVAAFALTVGLWVLPGIVALVGGAEGPGSAWLGARLPESSVALLGAGLLFVLPVNWKERRFTLTWRDAQRIDWGTLMLFGGGLALGTAMFKTGLSTALGHSLTAVTGAHSTAALTIVFSIFAIYFTEVTSNTAAATMLVPLAIAAARSAGADPVPPAVGCAIGCSMAFMLPVATPPNAIIYGSGCVRITQMVRAGFWINIGASVIVPTGVLVMCRWLGL